MAWLDALGTLFGIGGVITGWIAYRTARQDRGSDKLEALSARLTRVETQLEPFWAAVQADMIKLLHHPWPERADMDNLLDKLRSGTLSAAERVQLKTILQQIIDDNPADPPPFRVGNDERVAAIFLLHTMDLVQPGGTDAVE